MHSQGDISSSPDRAAVHKALLHRVTGLPLFHSLSCLKTTCHQRYMVTQPSFHDVKSKQLPFRNIEIFRCQKLQCMNTQTVLRKHLHTIYTLFCLKLTAPLHKNLPHRLALPLGSGEQGMLGDRHLGVCDDIIILYVQFVVGLCFCYFRLHSGERKRSCWLNN